MGRALRGGNRCICDVFVVGLGALRKMRMQGLAQEFLEPPARQCTEYPPDPLTMKLEGLLEGGAGLQGLKTIKLL